MQASRIRYEQFGEATLAMREDIVVDTQTRVVAKQETVVAAVPTDGGQTAILVGQTTTAGLLQGGNNVLKRLCWFLALLNFILFPSTAPFVQSA